MPPLHPISRTALIRKLKNSGFAGPYSATRHQYMEKGNQRIFIPNPHGSDIGVPLIKQIIKQLEVDREKFLDL